MERCNTTDNAQNINSLRQVRWGFDKVEFTSTIIVNMYITTQNGTNQQIKVLYELIHVVYVFFTPKHLHFKSNVAQFGDDIQNLSGFIM